MARPCGVGGSAAVLVVQPKTKKNSWSWWFRRRIELDGVDVKIPQILTGALSSKRLGCFKKMSLE